MERRAGTRQGWCPACFNPRSRVGSDDRIFGNEVADHVSIHVPAWGATHRQSWLPVLGNVSIHAPAWGATMCNIPSRHRCRCFNPRSRVGSDVGDGQLIGKRLVSIHAPAWGATHYVRKKTENRPKVSIHAPAWGATFAALKSFLVEPLFQSTLPRGERLGLRYLFAPRYKFQSTLPRGERHMRLLLRSIWNAVSIHAPAWGATEKRDCLISDLGGFNPRSRVGSDRLISKRLIMSNI